MRQLKYNLEEELPLPMSWCLCVCVGGGSVFTCLAVSLTTASPDDATSSLKEFCSGVKEAQTGRWCSCFMLEHPSPTHTHTHSSLCGQTTGSVENFPPPPCAVTQPLLPSLLSTTRIKSEVLLWVPLCSCDFGRLQQNATQGHNHRPVRHCGCFTSGCGRLIQVFK